MLGVWVRCAGWYPAMNDVSDLLSGVLGVVGLVQQFAILSCLTVGDLVQVDSFVVSELRQKLCDNQQQLRCPL